MQPIILKYVQNLQATYKSTAFSSNYLISTFYWSIKFVALVCSSVTIAG